MYIYIYIYIYRSTYQLASTIPRQYGGRRDTRYQPCGSELTHSCTRAIPHRRNVMRACLHEWRAYNKWLHRTTRHFRAKSNEKLLATIMYAWGEHARMATAERVAEEARMVKIALDFRCARLAAFALRTWEAEVAAIR